MQGGCGTQSSDQFPNLTYSTAAREAAPQDNAPTHAPSKSSSTLLARPRGLRSDSAEPVLHTPPLLLTDYAENSMERRPSPARRAQSSDIGHQLSPFMAPKVHDEKSRKNVTVFCVGMPGKKFQVDTATLVQTAPYFEEIAGKQDDPLSQRGLVGPFNFTEFDPFSFALFERWVLGETLHGPHDFHTMNHYLGLYVIGSKFQIESLRNKVMDLVRRYYRLNNMTSPAFRLDMIYSQTDSPCPMREFLITTAAYRALAEAEYHSNGLTESVKSSLKSGGDMALDFAIALCSLVGNGREDVRKGDPCRWHDHQETNRC